MAKPSSLHFGKKLSENLLQYTRSGQNHNLRSRPAFGRPRMKYIHSAKVYMRNIQIYFLVCKKKKQDWNDKDYFLHLLWTTSIS